MIKSIIKILRTSDNSISHYDVNYDGFVIAVKPEEITGDHTYENIASVAAPKAAALEEIESSYTSESVLP